GAGAEQFPTWLGSRHVLVDQPTFRQPILFVAAVMLGSEAGSNRLRRTPPEWKLTARYPLVNRRGDVEAVVQIAFVIADEARDFLRDGLPRRAREAEPGSEAIRVSKWKIKTDQHSLAALHWFGKPVREQCLRLVPSGGVGELLARPIMPADPDAIPAD